MKFAYQTIIWGSEISDIANVLDIIADAGYQGFEIAQAPSRLGIEGGITTLLELARSKKLELIGLAGGSLRQRLAFCESHRSSYLYVEGWDEIESPLAIEAGFTLALHPHVFKHVHRLEQAADLLERHPTLKFLPDTAHLYIAGDDPVDAIRTLQGRLAAVHLKDWTPEFGRSSHRYARGFIELGRGVVHPENVISELERQNYEGWVVVEQDCSRSDPQTSVIECAKWLRKRGLMPSMAPRAVRVVARPIRPISGSPNAELRFLRELMKASTEWADECYFTIAQAFYDLIPSHAVVLWSCSPGHNVIMSNLATYPRENRVTEKALQRLDAINRETLETEIACTDISDPMAFPEFTPHLASQNMLTLHIYNSCNYNHLRFIINIFCSSLSQCFADDDLKRFGNDVGHTADTVLDEFCMYAATSVQYRIGLSDDSQSFARQVLKLIQNSIQCEAATILLVNDAGDRLTIVATTGVVWMVPKEQEYYLKNEGLTGQVWARNEAILTLDSRREPGRKGKSFESVKTNRSAYLLVPWLDTKGNCVGVVRCQNKIESDQTSRLKMFSDDDRAILDAIGQSALPHLQALLGEERRARTMGRLTHELARPLQAILTATGLVQAAFKEKGIVPAEFLGEDFIGDIGSWTGLMRRLIGNVDLTRFTFGPIPVEARFIYLMKDVVAPAVRQVAILLREESLSEADISYDRFESIPRLWVDQNQFQQIVFNLLANAIKYSFRDRFQVKIVTEMHTGEYVVRFQDWGIGIDERLRTEVFKEGVRSQGARDRNVSGQGLGLWIVRNIVYAHGGRIAVTGLHLPTEISVFLPRSLSWRPPSKAAVVLGG